MNLPAVTVNELLDQNLAAEDRGALWSRVLVRALVEHASEPTWFPVEQLPAAREIARAS
jgi:hypothetical protein